MKNVTLLLLAAVALTSFSTTTAVAKDLNWGPIQIDIPGYCPKPGDKPKPRHRYRVTLYHPISGGVVYSRVANSSQDADRIADNYRRQHWKIWKYNGIGQELQSRQFSSYNAANRYQPPKKILGFNKRYVKAGRVSVRRI
ncbi:hypothetical protein AB1K70_17965 [Bremerella sp. JC770]|uniref:hypothetical protein n=1 Tax=Bremerella sp. JC770 TaxID=3232137 RepID=UPI003457C1A3